MKATYCLLLFALVGLNLAAAYTTKYDNIDLDEILNNRRLYSKYFDCLKGGKCTTDGKELKDALPDALANGCKSCSEKQKIGTEKVMRYMLEKRPEDYRVLEKIYDPQGKFKQAYQEEAAKRGLKV